MQRAIMKKLNMTICLAAVFFVAPSLVAALECSVFPADNIWNTPVDTLPVHSHSVDFIDTIGVDRGLHR